MNYEQFYDLIQSEEKRLKREMSAIDCLNEASTVGYRLCKALAACYELQEHLAERLSEQEKQP